MLDRLLRALARSGVSLVAPALLLGGCATPAANAPTPPGPTPPPLETTATMTTAPTTTAPTLLAAPGPSSAAAPVSGHITVYGALTDTNGAELARAFQQANPHATVDVVTGGTGALITRIESERRAGQVRADVLLLADPTVMQPLNDAGVLSSYAPAAAASLPAALRGQGWTGAFTFNNVILYHQGGSAPTDWADLASPAYKDKLELGDPSYSGTTLGLVAYLGRTLGWDFFQRLQQNGARVVQSTNTVGTDIAQGSVDAGISLDSVGRDLLSKGSPVATAWPASGAIPVPAPVAVVKGHESAASQAFADWLLSDAGQAVLVKLGYAPLRGTSDAVPATAKLVSVDWSQIASERDATIAQFKAIFP
jgi:iron(III) transport system substrate-binding protein